MADADVTVKDASNTDRKVDTRTVGGGTDEHRQVVCVGDPDTAANVQAVTSAGAARVASHRDTLRIQVAVSGVTTATTAYTAGDQVGTLISLADAGRSNGNTGRIVGVVLHDASDIIGAYDVVFFRSSVTLAADNAVFSISDTDALELVGIAQLAGAFDIGNNRICQSYNLAIPYDTGSNTTLYAALICRVGHTFFASGSTPALTVFVERD